ncbi:MAG TPA: HD domain-containing phosphohydrolase [Longimicrobiales bacterium]
MTESVQMPERILIIDDEENVVALIERILRRGGYENVRTATDARLALPLFREFEPDLILMDLHMPFLDGVNVMQQLRQRNEAGEFLPVVLVTGDTAPGARQQALSAGANDFLLKPFDATDVLLRIRNLLDLRKQYHDVNAQVDRHRREVRELQIEMAERLARVAEGRDSADGSLPAQFGMLCAAIAEELGLDNEQIDLIRWAAPLHDIGMVGMPEILVKPGSLSLEELDLLKTHTSIGSQVVSGSRSPILRMAEEIALYHHENWDGTGYTPGLSGDSIPLPARIVAVADTFFAMTHDRPYQRARPVGEVLSWIEEQAGRKFDPAVVRAFMDAYERVSLPLLEEVE